MTPLALFLLTLFLLSLLNPSLCNYPEELRALMELKSSLDPEGTILSSWTSEGDPCTFVGVACNEHGNVANLSLQGKNLSGSLSPSLSQLQSLSGLYLHYNALKGEIPREITNLTDLLDLYLNVNNLSGTIPEDIGNMARLQGIEYLHSNKANKPSSLVHQNLSAEKVLIDHHFAPLLSSSGLHKLLADDVVFSTLKSSAAMGYLAPEYTTTGRFTEKSDVYAFGVIIFQILTGKTKVTHLRLGAESGKLEDLVDENLNGNFSKVEAAKMASIALVCTSEAPSKRPKMETVLKELGG